MADEEDDVWKTPLWVQKKLDDQAMYGRQYMDQWNDPVDLGVARPLTKQDVEDSFNALKNSVVHRIQPVKPRRPPVNLNLGVDYADLEYEAARRAVKRAQALVSPRLKMARYDAEWF